MDRETWPSTYDRDLDVPSRLPTGPTGPIDPYRRLVVNPLLAVAFGVGSILLMRSALQWRNLSAFLAAVGGLGVSLLFIQFHCLDCGKTAWLLASRRHACEPLLSRWRQGRPGRWPFPGLKTQIAVWFHVLAAAAVLVLILFVLGKR